MLSMLYVQLSLPVKTLAWNHLRLPSAFPCQQFSRWLCQHVHEIAPVCLSHLETLWHKPSLPKLLASATFLSTALPARLQHHIAQVQILQQTCDTKLAEFVDGLKGKTALQLELLQQFPRSTQNSADLHEVATHLRRYQDGLEADLSLLNSQIQRACEQPWWWTDAGRITSTNGLLDLCNWHLLSVRILTSQHLATWHKHQHPEDSKVHSLVYRRCPVFKLLGLTVEDCRAFCIEKNSTAPYTVVEGEQDLHVDILDSYVTFVFTEVLRNAMQAMINKHGAWDVDEAEPIKVSIVTDKHDTNFFNIQVLDTAGGIPESSASNMFSYFFSTATKRKPQFGYSRDHGSQFHGQGVGIPLSRLYAHFMGGEIDWSVDRAAGTTAVTIRLPKDGFCF